MGAGPEPLLDGKTHGSTSGRGPLSHCLLLAGLSDSCSILWLKSSLKDNYTDTVGHVLRFDLIYGESR